MRGANSYTYMERLDKLNLWTLEERRNRSDLIEVVLSHDNHNLHGHKLKLYKSRSRLNTRKFFYSQHVNVWNKLPSNVIEAETVITFKNRLDKCEDWGI